MRATTSTFAHPRRGHHELLTHSPAGGAAIAPDGCARLRPWRALSTTPPRRASKRKLPRGAARPQPDAPAPTPTEPVTPHFRASAAAPGPPRPCTVNALGIAHEPTRATAMRATAPTLALRPAAGPPRSRPRRRGLRRRSASRARLGRRRRGATPTATAPGCRPPRLRDALAPLRPVHHRHGLGLHRRAVLRPGVVHLHARVPQRRRLPRHAGDPCGATPAHRCVQCVTDDQCPTGQRCTDFTCGQCTTNADCPPARCASTAFCRRVAATRCAPLHVEPRCAARHGLQPRVDTQSNVNNCGACGTARRLANATRGVLGAAAAMSCAAGSGDCDMDDANGCETNVQTSMHCGMVRQRLHRRPGYYRRRLRCARRARRSARAGRVDAQTDRANCGMCGNACPPRRPASRACARPRARPSTNGRCVDTRTDGTNCAMRQRLPRRPDVHGRRALPTGAFICARCAASTRRPTSPTAAAAPTPAPASTARPSCMGGACGIAPQRRFRQLQHGRDRRLRDQPQHQQHALRRVRQRLPMGAACVNGLCTASRRLAPRPYNPPAPAS